MIRGTGIIRWVAALTVVGAAAYLAGSGGIAPALAVLVGSAGGLLAALIWLLTATPLAPAAGRDGLRGRLTVELDRCRRRGHHLALVRLTLSADPSARVRLPAFIRQMDHLAIADEHAYLLLPEASRSEAELLVGRIGEAVPAAFADSTPLIAVFPEDGLTERALLAAVDGHPYFAEPLGIAGLRDPGSADADGADDTASERQAAG
ncbi:MAG: hypothetical protein H0U86_00905 [Chloroflexi bacterium]|nr:hypothetical protein [Chloroflexota bacterium]